MARKSSVGIAAGILTALAGGGLVWWTQRAPSAPSGCSEAAIRARVVAVAMSQVGKADLPLYIADAAPMYVGQKPEWCGIFALWAYHQAGLGRGVQWKVGLGFVEPQRFPRVSVPKPGDLAYYDAPFQHHALVRDVRGDTVDLINGNGAGGQVTLSSKPIGSATFYYSLSKWIDKTVAEGCK